MFFFKVFFDRVIVDENCESLSRFCSWLKFGKKMQLLGWQNKCSTLSYIIVVYLGLLALIRGTKVSCTPHFAMLSRKSDRARERVQRGVREFFFAYLWYRLITHGRRPAVIARRGGGRCKCDGERGVKEHSSIQKIFCHVPSWYTWDFDFRIEGKVWLGEIGGCAKKDPAFSYTISRSFRPARERCELRGRLIFAHRWAKWTWSNSL